MILPAKHLSRDRAMLDIGAEILSQLNERRTVSELWYRVHASRVNHPFSSPISFDWFILTLSFLYSVSAIDFLNGLVTVTRK